MELVYDVNEIQKTAEKLWKEVADSKVITFTGQMGAGKTTLIQAVCQHLGVKGSVSSPTFSIINEYDTSIGPVYHIDLYRCKDEEEVIRAGVEDCLYSGNTCFVEWPSIAANIFPPDIAEVSISEINNNTRKIMLNRKL